ncbi:MAG: aspartyl protease family protein [Pseudomonadota bacterium]
MALNLRHRLAVAACAALMASQAGAEPLELLPNGLAVAQVSLDGRGPYRFVIDTAATNTSLLQPYWAAVGPAPAAAKTLTIQGAGGAATVPLVPVAKLATAGRVVEGLEAYQLPPNPADALGAHGILGADVLTRHVLELDTPAKAWRLLDRTPEADAALVAVPFVLDAGRTPRLTVRVNGVEVRAIIDTGAARTIMNWAAAEALGVKRTEALAEGGVAGGVGGSTALLKRRFDSLAVAGSTRTDVELRVGDLPIFGALGLADGPAVIVGIDQFTDRRLLIDYPNLRLRVAAPAGA